MACMFSLMSNATPRPARAVNFSGSTPLVVKVEPPAMKRLAESLKLEYAQFLELEVFTRFGTMVDERTRKTIEHGRRIRAVLAQRQFAPSSLGEEIEQELVDAFFFAELFDHRA